MPYCISLLLATAPMYYHIACTLKVTFASIGMGNGMELQTIKKHLKTPKAPLIALASQYTFMPLVSFVKCISFGLLSGLLSGRLGSGDRSTIYIHVQ